MKKISKEEKVLERNTLRSRKKLLKEYQKATKEPKLSSEEKEIIKQITISFVVGMYVLNIVELLSDAPFMREAMLLENLLLPVVIGIVVVVAIFFNRLFL